MKTIFCFLTIMYFAICPLIGQMVSIAFGDTYITDKSRVKLHPEVLGKGVGGNDDWFYQITYGHWLNKKLFLSGSYSRYPVSTLFYFKYETGRGDYGWPGGNIANRFDLGFGWNIFHKTKFIVQPIINLALMNSKDQGLGIVGIIPTDILPEGFMQIAPVEAIAYNNTQITPVMGIKLGYVLWNRLELFLDIRQVWGFKTVQELRLQYTYKGVDQPDAVNYSDGTGRFWALGIGYRFVKPKSK